MAAMSVSSSRLMLDRDSRSAIESLMLNFPCSLRRRSEVPRQLEEPAGRVKLTSEYVFCWYLNRKRVSAQGIQFNSRIRASLRHPSDPKERIGLVSIRSLIRSILRRLRSFDPWDFLCLIFQP